jgi:hypothetical protein
VGEAQNLIGRTLRLISSLCGRDARQLPQQLVGRLGSFETIGASGFIDRARRLLLPRSSIVPLGPTLTAPRRRSAGGTEAEKIHAEMCTNDPRWPTDRGVVDERDDALRLR